MGYDVAKRFSPQLFGGIVFVLQAGVESKHRKQKRLYKSNKTGEKLHPKGFMKWRGSKFALANCFVALFPLYHPALGFQQPSLCVPPMMMAQLAESAGGAGPLELLLVLSSHVVEWSAVLLVGFLPAHCPVPVAVLDP